MRVFCNRWGRARELCSITFLPRKDSNFFGSFSKQKKWSLPGIYIISVYVEKNCLGWVFFLLWGVLSNIIVALNFFSKAWKVYRFCKHEPFLNEEYWIVFLLSCLMRKTLYCSISTGRVIPLIRASRTKCICKTCTTLLLSYFRSEFSMKI